MLHFVKLGKAFFVFKETSIFDPRNEPFKGFADQNRPEFLLNDASKKLLVFLSFLFLGNMENPRCFCQVFL